MHTLSRRSAFLLIAAALAACGRREGEAEDTVSTAGLHGGETPEMRALIRKYAGIHGIPESLLHRV
ncbi:MAG: lytic transglycosylase domain-containing protein, partial [Paracoccaceae bacterium]